LVRLVLLYPTTATVLIVN